MQEQEILFFSQILLHILFKEKSPTVSLHGVWFYCGLIEFQGVLSESEWYREMWMNES